ncbi:MAG: hypothetical protein H6738_18445 [Alphaproteobacteria bacterium]|nr:hypothetical protein [Alphaproteobacteria bacterium]
MTAARTALGALVGLGVGLAGGWWLAEADEPPRPDDVARTPSEATAPPAPRRAVPTTEGCDDVERQLVAARFEVALLRGQLRSYGGQAVPWPDDAPADQRPEAFAEAFRAFATEEGVEVTELDCGEYPCAAVVEVEGIDTDRQIGIQVALARLAAAGFHDARSVTHLRVLDDETFRVAWSAVPAGGADDDLTRRVDTRLDDLLWTEH